MTDLMDELNLFDALDQADSQTVYAIALDRWPDVPSLIQAAHCQQFNDGNMTAGAFVACEAAAQQIEDNRQASGPGRAVLRLGGR